MPQVRELNGNGIFIAAILYGVDVVHIRRCVIVRQQAEHINHYCRYALYRQILNGY